MLAPMGFTLDIHPLLIQNAKTLTKTLVVIRSEIIVQTMLSTGAVVTIQMNSFQVRCAACAAADSPR